MYKAYNTASICISRNIFMHKNRCIGLDIHHNIMVFSNIFIILPFCIFIYLALYIQIFRYRYTYLCVLRGLHLHIDNQDTCLYIHLYIVLQMRTKQI